MRTVTSEFERIWISLWDKSLWQHRECNGKILTSVQGRALMKIRECRLIRLVTDETDKLLPLKQNSAYENENLPD